LLEGRYYLYFPLVDLKLIAEILSRSPEGAVGDLEGEACCWIRGGAELVDVGLKALLEVEAPIVPLGGSRATTTEKTSRERVLTSWTRASVKSTSTERPSSPIRTT